MSTERSFQAELDLARPFTEDDPCLPVCPWNAGLAIVPGGTPDSDVNISSRISWLATILGPTRQKNGDMVCNNYRVVDGGTRRPQLLILLTFS